MKRTSFAYRGLMLASILLIFYSFYHTSFGRYALATAVYPFFVLNQQIVEPAKKGQNTKSHDSVETVIKQNQLLQMQNIRLRAALAHCDAIQELHAFNKRYHGQGQITQIMARNFTTDAHYFLVDAGSNKGITKDMVVLYKNNIVGRISEVYPWYSKVCLVTDRACKIAAFCVQTRAKGIHEGDNSESHAALQFVSHLSLVKNNDLVLSSGQGLIFPAGFALGRIASCTDNGLYKRIAVKPLCDMRDIDYCVILAKGNNC